MRLRRFFLNVKNMPDLSIVDSNLYIGGFCKIKNLSDYGIQAILDLREEGEDDSKDLEKYSMQYLRIGIHDRGIPTLHDTQSALDWIRHHLNDNKKVFIHCNLGRGRAPLMACLYLISKDVERRSAIKLVKKSRKYTYFNQNQLQYINKFIS